MDGMQHGASASMEKKEDRRFSCQGPDIRSWPDIRSKKMLSGLRTEAAPEAPDIRWTGHPVGTGHPVVQDALWIAPGRTTPEAPDSRTTGHPVDTGHPADRTSGRYRTSGACPSPAGNQVLLKF